MKNDKIIGSLLAGAIGDCMGGPFEGQPGPLTYQAHDSWHLSDDTQLTLATYESITTCGFVSAQHIAETFLQYFRARKITGIGSSTLKAMRDLDAGGHWAICGAKGERAAGNGAAMRISPLAFMLRPEKDQDRQIIRDVCRITHHNDEAYLGALAILYAMQSDAIHDIILNSIEALPDSRTRDRLIAINQIQQDTPAAVLANEFGSSGYVVDSVPLALFCARKAATLPFEDVLIDAIEAGGDTDTIASMIGNIVGAHLGRAVLPEQHINRLPNIDKLTNIAKQFTAVCSKKEPSTPSPDESS
ncbi:MAG: ADP-ribosylglycohydrolase family protein [Candidatus Electrothrix aestuarii]|uniref:ADP-ribosylglycohydrolase family protein n=1 Tax=Candidatus Electrothrix aestuarii TaxID=3062594 RepID=A0AAU8LR94_9BACT|nr:ADP-ribosylglycohydrolase family protein [Candidatus Electrothrix aestuarii]